ncbi:MAG: DUF3592 domain-containing protein [Candidatus Eremiobacteraeota bacterium]|nr:DUF3592 domain-containing protein [Candidatus Eremiobacteraeota bacterium]
MGKIDTYELARPPRSVPLTIFIKLLFGGSLNIVAWIIFGFSMIFYWGLVMNADLTSLIYPSGSFRTARGQIMAIRDTSFSEGGSESHSGTPIVAYHFRFSGPDGKAHEGVSYSLGGHVPHMAENPSEGNEVTVLFQERNPAVSRIEGLRHRPFTWPVVFVALFPSLGLGLVTFGFLSGLKANRLMVGGFPALGALVSNEPTNMTVNNRPVYALTFEFEARNGRKYRVNEKTNEPEKLEDDPSERLLYDGENPSYAVMFDSLPGSPAIDARGNFVDRSPLGALAVLIAPGITIAGHGLYALHACFHLF